MDDDYFANNIQLNSSLINTSNGEINEVAVNAIIKSNNEILLRAIEEHMQNTAQFFNNPLLSDVILRLGTKSYYAHKFILAKSSDVFQTMLFNKNWSLKPESNNATATTSKDSNDSNYSAISSITTSFSADNIQQIDFVETEECAAVFEKFLKFFYTAEILITSEEVIGLLYLADKYNVITLRNLASQYMMIKAKSPNVKNAIDWYRIAKDFKLNDLKDVCMKTIAWNCEYVVNSDDWLDFDLDFIKDLLQNSDLVISNEFILFNAITKWLLYDGDLKRKENLKENSNCLLPLIRFSQMFDIDLYEIEKCELAHNNSCETIIKEQLYKAYRFRVLEELIIKSFTQNLIQNTNNSLNLTEYDKSNDIEFYDYWYLPREYTELNLVDIIEIKNTLRVGIQVDVKTFKGVAPKKERLSEWKVLYRSNNTISNRWTLRISYNPQLNNSSNFNENSFQNISYLNNMNFIKAKVSAIVYNCEHTVLQVEHGRTFTFNGTNYYDIDLNLCYPLESKELYLLIKPVLF